MLDRTLLERYQAALVERWKAMISPEDIEWVSPELTLVARMIADTW